MGWYFVQMFVVFEQTDEGFTVAGVKGVDFVVRGGQILLHSATASIVNILRTRLPDGIPHNGRDRLSERQQAEHFIEETRAVEEWRTESDHILDFRLDCA